MDVFIRSVSNHAFCAWLLTFVSVRSRPQRVQLPRRVARQYPSYGLYLYGEGAYAQETKGLKLTGAPVLFLPGNAGSYKQGEMGLFSQWSVSGSCVIYKSEYCAHFLTSVHYSWNIWPNSLLKGIVFPKMVPIFPFLVRTVPLNVGFL